MSKKKARRERLKKLLMKYADEAVLKFWTPKKSVPCGTSGCLLRLLAK